MNRIPASTLIKCGLVALLLLIVASVFLPRVEQSRRAARRMQSRNNLRVLAVAMSHYHDNHRQYPAGGIVDNAGRESHGWALAILPYVSSSPIYFQVDQNVPWHDPANELLFQLVDPAFQSPWASAPTTPEGYQLAHYAANPHVFHRNSAVTNDAFAPGVGDVWLIGEAAGNFLPWGSAFNWRPLGDRVCDSPASFGAPGDEAAQFVFADESVKSISAQIDASILQAMRNAHPAPAADAMRTPPFPARFPATGRFEERGPIGECVYVAVLERDRSRPRITIRPRGKSKVGDAPDAGRLHAVLSRYPDAVELDGQGVLVLGAETASALAAAPKLETLQVREMRIDADVLSRLKSLADLRSIVIVEAEAGDQQRLEEALPDVRISGRQEVTWQP